MGCLPLGVTGCGVGAFASVLLRVIPGVRGDGVGGGGE